MNPLRLLIIEDNQDIAENIADYLEPKGHVLDFAIDGISGLHLALTHDFDAILLDIMLPGMEGLSLCRKLREEGRSQTPVLMLTARDALSDKIEGFDAGADDYLVKPFVLEELEARLHALVRRSGHKTPVRFRIADLEIDTGSMKIRRAGRTVEINPTCWKILLSLVDAHPNVVTRTKLEHLLWGDSPPESDAIRSHIYTLRKTIDHHSDTPLIHTVHGIGYRLADFDEISP